MDKGILEEIQNMSGKEVYDKYMPLHKQNKITGKELQDYMEAWIFIHKPERRLEISAKRMFREE